MCAGLEAQAGIGRGLSADDSEDVFGLWWFTAEAVAVLDLLHANQAGADALVAGVGVGVELDGHVDVAAGIHIIRVDDRLALGVDDHRLLLVLRSDEPVAGEFFAAGLAAVVGLVAVAQWRVLGVGRVDGLCEGASGDAFVDGCLDGRVDGLDRVGIGLLNEEGGGVLGFRLVVGGVWFVEVGVGEASVDGDGAGAECHDGVLSGTVELSGFSGQLFFGCLVAGESSRPAAHRD